MEEFHNKKGWLEEEIERTKVFINTTRLKDLMETVRAYTADEEPVLDKDKPFQLWTHFQDEPPGIFEGFELRSVAEARGCEYSLKPIIYGTVYLYDKDKFCLGRFEDGRFEHYTVQHKRVNDGQITGYEWRHCSCPNKKIHITLPKPKPFIVSDLSKEWLQKASAEEDKIQGGLTAGSMWADPRPKWDAYFMSEAFRVSRRSLDPHTKHGCVLVKDRRIVSTGYNSPPPGFNDVLADLERPSKYAIMIHSEINSISNAAREGYATKNTTAYITGLPCSDCYRTLWSAGIEEIVYAPISLEYFTKDHIARLPAASNGPKLTLFPKERMKEVIKILDDEYDYIMERVFGEVNTPVSAPAP